MSTDAQAQLAQPTLIHDGLAIYSQGQGAPLLLLPYPHGFTRGPTAQGALAQVLLGLGRRVVTFDPPGAYRSTRPARVDMAEMLACIAETLDALDLPGPLDVVGHSMGGLCALAWTLAHPERVRRLVLVGSVSGGPAIQRCRGMPWGMKVTDPDFWRFVLGGLRLNLTGGNLAVHKRVLRLIWRHSYVDQTLVPDLPVLPEDRHLPAPIRDRWPNVARKLDYAGQLDRVHAPTLVCVGRRDPQAPLACSEELARGIPGARLAVFERSGHYPFIEERERFAAELRAFLKDGA